MTHSKIYRSSLCDTSDRPSDLKISFKEFAIIMSILLNFILNEPEISENLRYMKKNLLQFTTNFRFNYMNRNALFWYPNR